MSITIDDQPLGESQFKCVGDVLEHVRGRDKDRLIVRVLLDGAVPGAAEIGQRKLGESTLYVETANRRELVGDALREAEEILDGADSFRQQAIDELSAGKIQDSMLPLNQWLASWRQSQTALVESAWAVGVNLETLGIQDLVGQLANQLRQIKTALESKDYVTLADILNYEAPASMERWREALGAVVSQI
jgi:hypothetical protein